MRPTLRRALHEVRGSLRCAGSGRLGKCGCLFAGKTAHCTPLLRCLTRGSPCRCRVLRRARLDTWAGQLRDGVWEQRGYMCSVEDPFDRYCCFSTILVAGGWVGGV